MGNSSKMHGPPRAVSLSDYCICSLQVKKIRDIKQENTENIWVPCLHAIISKASHSITRNKEQKYIIKYNQSCQCTQGVMLLGRRKDSPDLELELMLTSECLILYVVQVV